MDVEKKTPRRDSVAPSCLSVPVANRGTLGSLESFFSFLLAG